jgi:hypothetical protein
MARVVGKGSAVAGRSTLRIPGALLLLGALAAPAQAQDEAIILEVYGGAATYGRFLEQLATEGVGALRERELSAGAGPTFGGSVGFSANVWEIEDVAGSIGFQWVSSDFELENDDPRVRNDFDDGEAGSFSAYVVYASLTKFMADTDGTLAPYAIVGLNGTWWSLDADEPVSGNLGRVTGTADGDETVFRLGGTAGFGLQIRADDSFAVRLETLRHSIRNPFDGDGDSAYNITTGTKTDEPDRVSVTRYSLGLLFFIDW